MTARHSLHRSPHPAFLAPLCEYMDRCKVLNSSTCPLRWLPPSVWPQELLQICGARHGPKTGLPESGSLPVWTSQGSYWHGWRLLCGNEATRCVPHVSGLEMVPLHAPLFQSVWKVLQYLLDRLLAAGGAVLNCTKCGFVCAILETKGLKGETQNACQTQHSIMKL
jgi:hypothetical protein